MGSDRQPRLRLPLHVLLHRLENDSKVEDPEVDRLIDLGASQLPQDYQETYAELERLLVEGKAYFAPICRTMGCYGFNKNVIKEDTVTIGQSKYLYWSQLDYVDESLRDTRPLIVANERVLGQFDPATVDGTHRVLQTPTSSSLSSTSRTIS